MNSFIAAESLLVSEIGRAAYAHGLLPRYATTPGLNSTRDAILDHAELRDVYRVAMCRLAGAQSWIDLPDHRTLEPKKAKAKTMTKQANSSAVLCLRRAAVGVRAAVSRQVKERARAAGVDEAEIEAELGAALAGVDVAIDVAVRRLEQASGLFADAARLERA